MCIVCYACTASSYYLKSMVESQVERFWKTLELREKDMEFVEGIL